MRRFLVLPLLAILSILAACAPFSIRETDFFPDRSGFETVKHKRVLVRAHTEEDFSWAQYILSDQQIEKHEKKELPIPDPAEDGVDIDSAIPVLFIIAEPIWIAEPNSDRQRDQVAFTLRERMYRYILREYPHPVRVRYAWVPGESALEGYRLLEIRTAITDIKRGSGWVRYVIGYGAGAAVLQLEGQIVDITDPEREEVVAEFATRTAHAAYPQGFFNPNVIHDHYALMYAAEAGIRHLTPRLRQEIPAARLRPEAPATAAAAGP